MLVVIVEPVRVEKLINCEAIVDAFRVETVSVEFTLSVLVVIDEPTDVEKLINCEAIVDAFRVETVSVEFIT